MRKSDLNLLPGPLSFLTFSISFFSMRKKNIMNRKELEHIGMKGGTRRRKEGNSLSTFYEWR